MKINKVLGGVVLANPPITRLVCKAFVRPTLLIGLCGPWRTKTPRSTGTFAPMSIWSATA